MVETIGLFGFLSICVITAAVVNIVKARHSPDWVSRKGDEASGELARRVERLEQRVANLETIVVNREKAGRFE